MPGNKCVFLNCSNISSKNKDLAFHKFPADEKRKKIWLENCNSKASFMKNPRVCSDHFDPDDYERDFYHELLGGEIRKNLKSSAVPRRVLLLSDIKQIQIKEENIIDDFEERSEEQSNSYNDCCKSLIYENECLKTSQTNFLERIRKLKDSNKNLKTECDKLKEDLRQYQDIIKKQKKLLFHYKMGKHSEEIMIKKVYPKFEGVFSTEQLNLILKKKKKVNWTNRDIIKAITLKMLGKKAYIYLREKLNYPLPSIRTLQIWTSKLDIHAGFSNGIFDIMAIVGGGLSEVEKMGVLVCDEMKTKSTFEYSKEIDQVIANHSHMQVLLFRGLFSNWKQPLYIGFDEKMSREILSTTFEKLKNSGFTVVACVSNCKSSHIGLQRILNVDYTNCSFVNPSTGTPIFVFADAPQLLNIVRNWLLDTGFQLQDGTIITMEPLIDLLNSKLQIEGRTTFKLTLEHLTISDIKGQNVKLAAELLSRHTATALRHYKQGNDKQSADLADFIETVSDWFDLMNSHAKFGSPSQRGYGLELEKQNEILDKMFDLMQTMKCRKNNSMEIFQKDIMLSINSLKNLFLYLQEKYTSVKYIITKRLNQDALESFFDQLHQGGGVDDHPTPEQALNYIKIILFGKNPFITQGNGDKLVDLNVEEDYLTARLLKNLPMLNTEEKHISSSSSLSSASERTPETTNDGLEYIAGWIAKKFHKKYPELHCPIAPDINEHSYSLPRWVQHLSEGGHIQPTPEWKDKVLLMNNSFESNIPIDCDIDKVKNIRQGLVTKIINQIECPEELLICFLNLRIVIRVKYLNMLLEGNKALQKKQKRLICPRQIPMKMPKLIYYT